VSESRNWFEALMLVIHNHKSDAPQPEGGAVGRGIAIQTAMAMIQILVAV